MSAGDVFEWGIKIVFVLVVASVAIPYFLYSALNNVVRIPISISARAKVDTTHVGAYNTVYVNSLSQFIFSVLTITVSDSAREELYGKLQAICETCYDPEDLTKTAISQAYWRYADIVEEALQAELEPDFKVSCCFKPYYQNLPKVLQYNDYAPMSDIMLIIDAFIEEGKIIVKEDDENVDTLDME